MPRSRASTLADRRSFFCAVAAISASHTDDRGTQDAEFTTVREMISQPSRRTLGRRKTWMVPGTLMEVSSIIALCSALSCASNASVWQSTLRSSSLMSFSMSFSMSLSTMISAVCRRRRGNYFVDVAGVAHKQKQAYEYPRRRRKRRGGRDACLEVHI